MGKYQARQAGAAIVARRPGEEVSTRRLVAVRRHRRPRRDPAVVFTDPQVASVGRTVAEAEKAGLPHRVVEYADRERGRRRRCSPTATTGTAIAVVDTEREVLLGVTFVGPGVAEMIHAATIAIVGEVPIARLWHAVPAYPTISEIWLRLLETYRG